MPSVSIALFASRKDRANFTHSVHPGYVHACVCGGHTSCSPQCTSSENSDASSSTVINKLTYFSLNKMLYKRVCGGHTSSSPQCTSSENSDASSSTVINKLTYFSLNKMLYKRVHVCSYVNVKFSYNLCFVPT